MRTPFVSVLLIVGTALWQPQLRAADTLALKAEAGLNGICKPGRWVPVRVAVGNNGRDLAGELVVQWGEATVHRSVALAAPSRSEIEIYVRASEPRETVGVRLRSDDSDLRSFDVPMRVMAPDAVVTLCVTPEGSVAADAAECTATVSTDALPRSMRGYDAVDRIDWRAGPEAALPVDQRRALEHWRAYRRLAAAGVASLAPRVSPPAPQASGPHRPFTVIGAAIGVYVLSLGALAVFARRVRARPLAAFGFAVALALAGSSAALMAGRAGPVSAVEVVHQSTLLQLPDGGGLITMRGVALFPTYDTFQLTAVLADASLDKTSGSRSEQWFDQGGYPRLSGVFGLGASAAFGLEGVLTRPFLQVERRGPMVRVTNVSSLDLERCRFTEELTGPISEPLRAGETVEATDPGRSNGAFFACEFVGSPVEFADARHPVDVDGLALVAVYVPAGEPDGAPER